MATVRALKMNGGITKEKLGEENLLAVEKGCDNLGRHIENLKSFGIPVIIAINHFISDTENEISKIKEYVLKKDCEAILCKHWEKGSKGTQYSFTTDPNRRGAPTGHSIPIREVRLSAGAGFIVVVCGDIMTMPGLPKIPSAENIYLNENSQIEGLF